MAEIRRLRKLKKLIGVGASGNIARKIPGFKRRCGQATLETALGGIIVAAVLAGMVDIGIAAHDYQVFDQSVNVAARAGAEQTTATNARLVAIAAYQTEMTNHNITSCTDTSHFQMKFGNSTEPNTSSSAGDSAEQLPPGSRVEVDAVFDYNALFGWNISFHKHSSYSTQAYANE